MKRILVTKGSRTLTCLEADWLSADSLLCTAISYYDPFQWDWPTPPDYQI